VCNFLSVKNYNCHQITRCFHVLQTAFPEYFFWYGKSSFQLPSGISNFPKGIGNFRVKRIKKTLTFKKMRVYKSWRRHTLPDFTPVPSAQAGLTTLFGMGRGGHYRYNHLKIVGKWLVVSCK
jgi:hypothetical protein